MVREDSLVFVCAGQNGALDVGGYGLTPTNKRSVGVKLGGQAFALTMRAGGVCWVGILNLTMSRLWRRADSQTPPRLMKPDSGEEEPTIVSKGTARSRGKVHWQIRADQRTVNEVP